MSPKIAVPIIVLCLLGAVVLTVRGCQNGEGSHWITKPMSEAELQQHIRQIESDPHMPQRAKDVAISQFRRSSQSRAMAPKQ